ncbi:unnamed protein product [Arctogadus glacialis]
MPLQGPGGPEADPPADPTQPQCVPPGESHSFVQDHFQAQYNVCLSVCPDGGTSTCSLSSSSPTGEGGGGSGRWSQTRGNPRSSLTCPHCLKQSNTFDPFLCISLPIPLRHTRLLMFQQPMGCGPGVLSEKAQKTSHSRQEGQQQLMPRSSWRGIRLSKGS